jgi:chromosome segregation ATPase
MVNELNREIEGQRSELQNQHSKLGPTSPNQSTKKIPTSTTNLREQLDLKEEQRQELISALADMRNDMVKIAEGNLKAMSEDEKQSLSVQALITNKTAQLQEKIDDYEGQIQNLKRELKTQKTLAQKYIDEATDAREKLGKFV